MLLYLVTRVWLISLRGLLFSKWKQEGWFEGGLREMGGIVGRVEGGEK